MESRSKSAVKSYEIYSAVDPSVVNSMLDWFRDNDRNVYKTAVSTLAQSRKLRAVFIQKKPLPEQYAWIRKTLQLKTSETIGEHLMQAWLMAGNQDMLAAFCDAMDIEHDGKGSVSGDLPDEFEATKLDAAVDSLVGKFDPQVVSVYLRFFNLQKPGGWPTLEAKLESDERLKLG
ncbi:hypothetical protein [Haloferula sargassicola]|uniref:Transposase n=1 Tax=Haloferula sargassicola TaxID=490096 RepID=A0ABP9UV58_9BACT